MTDEEYTNKKDEVDERNMVIKPLKGSMQLHAVVGVANGRLAVRNTSCACDECFNGTFNVKSICTWDECSIEVTPNETSGIEDNNSSDGNDNEEERTDVEKNTEKMNEISSLQVQVIDMDIEKFVVANYDEKKLCGTGFGNM